jgi:hypothetical protein
MKKQIITIFILPNEINLYKNLINNINKEFNTYDLKDFYLDVTLSVCDEMVDWDNSKIDKQTIIEKYNNINQNTPGIFNIDYNGEIMGCVSKRRQSVKDFPQAISFTWLDADFIFPEGTFYIIDQSLKELIKTEKYFILTPQYVKMWDASWDIVCHPNFLEKPYRYYEKSDPFKDAGIYGDIILQPLPKGVFKIGGGWITTFSKKLLNLIPIPQSFSHYGEEDTFITSGSKIFISKNYNINQYIIHNLVVTQDVHDRLNEIKLFDKRHEFRNIALQNFTQELNNLI